MPYIKQENRPLMDAIVDKMIDADIDAINLGNILYQYCEKYVKPSYNNYKNYIGELNESAAEIKRRIFVMDAETKCVRNHHEDMSLEDIVDLMHNNGLQVNGDLNYVLFKFTRNRSCCAICNYKSILNVVDQIRANILSPYEDSKIIENGDVV